MSEEYVVQGVSCCICQIKINGYGHNAAPLMRGICCDDCHHAVLGYRFEQLARQLP